MKLKVESLTQVLGANTILDALSFETGEIRSLAVIGPSGSGKSTLFRILAGLDAPVSGTVTLNGEQMPSKEKSLVEYRKKIGIVFQAYNLFPHLNALENILLPLEKVHGLNRAEAESRARDLLRRFKLDVHALKKPSQLSGGQKQRIAIVRAVAIQAKLILLDEPTSALDPEMTAEVLSLVEDLKNEGKNFILVTHEMAFARRVADEILFLARGLALDYGPAARIMADSQVPEVRAFLQKILL